MTATLKTDTPLILLAPDAFKGTFTAREVADAFAAGITRAGLRADLCPVADGGEGTMDALLQARGGTYLDVDATGPLGDPVRARVGLLPADADAQPASASPIPALTAVVDVAEASGWALVATDRRDAERASSFGTGQLIAAAVKAGATEILVAAGGSATTDGGSGAIDAIEQAGGLGSAHITVLCDVRTPFEAAARMFGPQKGASPATVERLTARLNLLALRLPRDPRGLPWTGCAGGLSGGLWAAFSADLVPGADTVLAAVGFDSRLVQAAAVITGEGRIDDQSFIGKITGEIAARAADAGIPVHAVVGTSAFERAHDSRLASLAEATTLAQITEAAYEVAAHRIRGRR